MIKGFHVFCKIPIWGSYCKDVKHMYETIKPTEEESVIVDTMKLILRSMFLSILLSLLCLRFRHGDLYYDITVLILVYGFQSQIIQRGISKAELRLLKQMEKFLGDVRHYYHEGGMVEEAIYDALEEADKEISLHMSLIYHILSSEDQSEAERYKEIVPNKYLSTFLALCQVTLLYGDTMKDESSLFLTNLNYLKNEINVELLKREKINHVFSGLIFTTLFPVFFLKRIESWSVSNLVELEKYYQGSYGILVTVIIALFTLLSYQLIIRLKGNHHIMRKEHGYLERLCNMPFINKQIYRYMKWRPVRSHKLDYLLKRVAEGITIRQFLLQKFLLFTTVFILTLLVSLHVVLVSKYNAIHYTKDFKGTSIVESEMEIEQFRRIIRDVAEQFKHKNVVLLGNQITDRLEDTYQITSEYTRESLADEIIKKIKAYQSHSYHVYYLIFALILALGISNIPLMILELKRHFLKMSMEDEVIQFHSIIMMLMYIQKMDVEIILDWMENFSEIFRRSIMECVDYYSYDDREALLRLKEQEPFLPFVRIVENLEACDRIGIEKAFDEIASQRIFFTEKRRQDNEIMISKKGVIGKVLAYVPLTLTIALYLIVPFVLESIAQLSAYLSQLQVS
jgi:hypothetical protein